MSAKVKMRCARCSKPFKSSVARQTLCPECEAKERAARAAGKIAGARQVAASPKPIAAPKIVGPGAGILDPHLAPMPAPPPAAPAQPASRPGPYGGSHAPHGASSARGDTAQQAAYAPGIAGNQDQLATGFRPQAHDKRPQKPLAPRAPREPKPRKPPTPPFQLTDELRARIEARYLELAQPVEFDGIRSRIAADLGLPKSAVKRTILDLRGRMQMPSWWELQAFTGTPEDLERIRVAYTPLLPIPPVGVHRQIATDLRLDASTVYQGIRRIRAEMRLPQYNPPDLHAAAVSASASESATVATASAESSAPEQP